MRLALAQLDPAIGDVAGNRERICEAAQCAHAAGARCLIVPTSALSSGASPARPADSEPAADRRSALDALASGLPPLFAVVGFADADGSHAAAVIRNGALIALHRPHLGAIDSQAARLPPRDARPMPTVVSIDGTAIGILTDDELATAAPAVAAQTAGADVLVVVSASPYRIGEPHARHRIVADRARDSARPIVYCNTVGGRGEQVFDGASFVVESGGTVVQQLPAFHEAIALVEIDNGEPKPVRGGQAEPLEANVYQALVVRVRNHAANNGSADARVVWSGGLSSALTLAIAIDALGPDHVVVIPMAAADVVPVAERIATLFAGGGTGFALLKDIDQRLLERLWDYRNALGGVADESPLGRPAGVSSRRVSSARAKVM